MRFWRGRVSSSLLGFLLPFQRLIAFVAVQCNACSLLYRDAVEASILEPATKFVQEARDLLKDCKNPQQQGALPVSAILAVGTMRVFAHAKLGCRISIDMASFSISQPIFADYLKTAMITGIGFIALGVAGYLIKLVHIPINNLLVGGGSA